MTTPTEATLAMITALREWKCPGCGGRKVYHQNARDTAKKTERGAALSEQFNPPPVPCKVCNGDGLHPLASAALAKANDAGYAI